MKKIYWIPICLLVLLLGVVITYVVVAESSLERVVKTFQETYKVERRKDSVDMTRVPGYLELLRERSRLNSQLELAKTDSVGLSLRLRDSVAELVVKGVVVADFLLQEIGVTPLFDHLSPESRYELLSEPWVITASESTISREPLNIIQAPKDTSEITPFVTPDTTHSEAIFFTFKTNKGIDLCFYQVERESKSDRSIGMQMARKEAMEQFRLFTDSIVHGGVPLYFPSIRIGMNRVDAKVLYRALPARGLVSVTF